MLYTRDDVMDALREIIAEVGPERSNDGMCVYVREDDHEDVMPHCVVGQVLFALDATEVLGEFDYEEFTGSLCSLLDPEQRDEMPAYGEALARMESEFQRDAIELLAEVQDAADRTIRNDEGVLVSGRVPWAEAVASATR